ncbi:DUF4825 domain-containing protein [Sanguibacter antarcticus]|nr:DUF4825 domain-containing protein [Sanguibacter antarcticus]
MGVLAVAIALGGCAPSSEQSEPLTRTESLWAARTEFVGDNSRMIALTHEAGFGTVGDFTLSLQTKEEPYGLTVVLDALDTSLDTVDLSSETTLVLGLVSNLEVVSVTSGAQSYSLTADEASDALGFDVKELGTDEARLEEYLDLSDD